MNVLLAGQYSGCGVGACTLMLHEPTPACIQVPYLREVEFLLLRAHTGLCSTTTVRHVSPIGWTKDELYLTAAACVPLGGQEKGWQGAIMARTGEAVGDDLLQLGSGVGLDQGGHERQGGENGGGFSAMNDLRGRGGCGGGSSFSRCTACVCRR